jgi:ATP-dependent Zn protease
MVMQRGMSAQGFVALLDNEGQPVGTPQSFHEAEREVKRILDGLYQRTTEKIREHRKTLDGIVAELLERGTISGDDIREIHRCVAQHVCLTAATAAQTVLFASKPTDRLSSIK